MKGATPAAYRVVCQGWSEPDDSWVTAGSCALEYELDPLPTLFERMPRWPLWLVAVIGLAVVACQLGVSMGQDYEHGRMLRIMDGGTLTLRGPRRPEWDELGTAQLLTVAVQNAVDQ